MASNRIIVDSALLVGGMVTRAVDRALDSVAELSRLKLLLQSAAAGDDWVSLAAELGLEDRGSYTKEQQAQDLLAILSTAEGQINHAAVLEMKRLDQGG